MSNDDRKEDWRIVGYIGLWRLTEAEAQEHANKTGCTMIGGTICREIRPEKRRRHEMPEVPDHA